MNPEILRQRTKAYSIAIVRMVEKLPTTRTAEIIGRQLLRSGMSVGANYRSACRAKSIADFIAKMGTVEEECDECLYWLEVLIETGLCQPDRLTMLMGEGNQILSIIITSIRTARARRDAGISNNCRT
jgi:four helix bundle protein